MDELLIKLMKYSRQGYCCSQIVPLLDFEFQDIEEPGLIKALAPLGFGISGGGCCCGALLGGLALLGYYGTGAADAALAQQSRALVDWFKAPGAPGEKGLSCAEVLDNPEAVGDMSGCGDIVLGVYGKVLEILSEAGYK